MAAISRPLLNTVGNCMSGRRYSGPAAQADTVRTITPNAIRTERFISLSLVGASRAGGGARGGFGERNHEERCNENPCHQAKDIVEGERESLLADAAAEKLLREQQGLRGVRGGCGEALRKRRDRISGGLRVVPKRLPNASGLDARVILQPGIDDGDADGAAEIAHEIEQSGGGPQF